MQSEQEFEFVFDAPPNDAQDTRRVYRVAELTRRISSVLEDEIGTVWVEGEVSNLVRPASGHLYFTLKDDQAQLSAVLFRGNQRGLRFELKDGMLVRVQGEISVYERRGTYQIIARQVEEAGKGSLQQQFEKLKLSLAAEGLFDESRKRPLPLLPRHIGIVTSSSGAAIRDIFSVLTRRFPNLHIVLAPAKVQGEGAAEEVVRGIERLNAREDIDVIIVGRGGGSLEDLWAFNEEQVARAIAASRCPVISAVGHEIDFTISDFVADRRAPTPSAAAEMVVGSKQEFEDRLDNLQRRLSRSLESRLHVLRRRLVACSRSYVFKEPGQLLRQHRVRLDSYDKQLESLLRRATRQVQQRVDEASIRIRHQMEGSVSRRRQQLTALQRHLGALNPLAVLERGYSITENKEGSVLLNASEVNPGQEVVTRLARGRFRSRVEWIDKGVTDGSNETRKEERN